MTHPTKLIVPVAAVIAVASCAGNPDRQTLARLHDVPADVAEVDVEDSLDRALESYRRFLEETPGSAMTPEAMRRLADLQLEREFGLIGEGDIVALPAGDPTIPGARRGADAGAAAATRLGEPVASGADASIAAAERTRRASAASGADLPAPAGLPAPAAASARVADSRPGETDPGTQASLAESDAEFEARTTAQFEFAATPTPDLELPDDAPNPALAGPLEAIRIYQEILEKYPYYERNDQVLYQMARAYDEIGEPDEAMAVMERMVADHNYSRHLDEVHFRRGEYLFTRRQFFAAESAYQAIIDLGPTSSYYELALYKLGWSLYKQELYEEALHRFMALLDFKLESGYDFDQSHEEEEERRVADTYRVISLSFSNLGGPEVIDEYFAAYGNRSYEDRIYSNLGEFYLEKLRYHDAAAVYSAFVELNPYHQVAPRFGMRVIDIYEEGGFPLLVVESKKDFATKYGLKSAYWDYFDVAEAPEVIGFLKTNLTDLANHYHALYQEPALVDERLANFTEASLWYREFLGSFPADPESPGINYQLADLLLENEDFGAAATEYERTAYDYEPHEQASAAGYAAIYAYRQQLERVDELAHDGVLRATVASSLRFADAFPEHENAAIVLGAAADDLYDMSEFEAAVDAGRKLIERYPAADPELRRSAWTVVAHSSFDLALYTDAEVAYTRVLELVPANDEARQGLVDNLAASIYKQGEEANAVEDYRAAADHFLRIRDVAPGSEIRSAAEYDAAAALIRLEDWAAAATVLEGFRRTFPEHELIKEATKQLASVYRSAGQLDRSASEYERVAAETDDPEVRREAMLLAGDLYEEAASMASALDVLGRYVDEFPEPLDVAQETRFKIAGFYEDRGDVPRYHETLAEIVASDEAAGPGRSDRSRYLAAQSALVLTGQLYDSFIEIQLVQPFETSLAEKQKRMNSALEAFEKLIDYEVGEVTAAATYHIAEIYFEFSRSLLESERPGDLDGPALVDYDLALEEEAFPFEEQAIEVHERNFELISAGVFNPWVQRSLDKLATLVPGRYAKAEISSGYVGSIDVYAYRTPNAPVEVVEGTAEDRTETAEGDQEPTAFNHAPGDPLPPSATGPDSDIAEVTSALAR